MVHGEGGKLPDTNLLIILLEINFSNSRISYRSHFSFLQISDWDVLVIVSDH